MTNSLTPQLLAAIEAGDEARVCELLARGAEVNQPSNDPDGETPLIRAVRAGRPRLVTLLLEHGAAVNQPQAAARAWTPVIFAHNEPAVLQLLIAAGADVNARAAGREVMTQVGGRKRRGGETALHLAAAANNPEAVKLLLDAGAALEAVAEDGGAPLDYALRLGTANTAAEALVAAGAQLTPQRLELMHSDALRPDTDVPHIVMEAIPGPAPANPKGGADRANLSGAAPEDRPEFRCPTCGALIYSRKPRLCGRCGARLPSELLLTDAEAHAIRDQRQWARDLANRFASGANSTASQPAQLKKPNLAQAEDLVRRASFAAEFQHRDRPDFWLYMVGYGFVLFVGGFVVLKLGGLAGLGQISPGALLLLIGFLGFHGWVTWQRASPICPNCRQNIRFCAAAYCHVCGKPLSHNRCADCSVDHSWLGFARPFASSGNQRWIAYCPGCGVGLDSKISRWRSR